VNGHVPGPQVPIIGQQQAQMAAAAQQLFLGMYVPLIPHLVVFRCAHGYEVEGGITEPATPDRVAAEAASYCQAAMKCLGFAVEKR
jgi:hypothetical protein